MHHLMWSQQMHPVVTIRWKVNNADSVEESGSDVPTAAPDITNFHFIVAGETQQARNIRVSTQIVTSPFIDAVNLTVTSVLNMADCSTRMSSQKALTNRKLFVAL
ncbi:hypothetical protein LSAT2_026682 [Lamellibrachia satsuma]|nr:hypothetical protein LSAT2_026682 [Lamellibrachia satsuma]